MKYKKTYEMIPYVRDNCVEGVLWSWRRFDQLVRRSGCEFVNHCGQVDVAITQESDKEVHALLICEHFKRVNGKNYDWKNTVGEEKCC